MKWRRFIPHTFLFFAGLGSAVWSFVRLPFPLLGENPLLDLVDYHTPNFYGRVMLWYYASPFVAVMLAGLILLSVWKVWLEGRGRDFAPFGGLPTWPLNPKQKAPAIVIGEVHHPVEAREIFNPSWLTLPERGLYTGVAIFGAVGSGKTSACMHPFARQLLGWQAGLVARFLLAGLHRFESAEPILRQGQGTVLATGLYQSGALDHRASPGAPGAVGDAAQDQASRSVEGDSPKKRFSSKATKRGTTNGTFKESRSKGLDLTPATESKANRLEHPYCRACAAHYHRSTRSDHGPGRAGD